MTTHLRPCSLMTLALITLIAASGCGGCDEETPAQPGADMASSPDAGAEDAQGDLLTPPTDMARDADPDPPDGSDMDQAMPECGMTQACPRGASCSPEGMCQLDTCAGLGCTEDERCEELAAGGAVCEDNRCAQSVDCPEARFCDAQGRCQLDTCTASVATCDPSTNALSVCADDGSAPGAPLACPLACDPNDGTGDAFCACRDDWECPTFMRCDVGRCRGSGSAPTCTLEPVPFAEARPTPEFSWGTQLSPEWPNPYPTMASVAQTTMVANLDDDNGDGLINELDFPEIIFVSGYLTTPPGWTGNARWNQLGVLRVLRGGGPRRGEQIFAVCGDRVWRSGDPVDEAELCDLTTGRHFRTFGGLAVADLDGDGTPEIIAAARTVEMGTNSALVRIYNPNGDLLLETPPFLTRDGGVGSMAIGVADVDSDGMAEVLVGALMISVERDTADGSWRHVETLTPQAERLNIACAAELVEGGGLEWFDRLVLWRKPAQPADRASRDACDGSEEGEAGAWCRSELTPVWDMRDAIRSKVNDSNPWQGQCAIVDVLTASGVGPSAEEGLDGEPEIVLIGEEELIILRASNGELLLRQDLNPLLDDPAPTRRVVNGGPPNVDDFDGDGFPEIGTAFSSRYVVIDLQPTTEACQPFAASERAAPSQRCTTSATCGESEFCDRSLDEPACRCLHNSWIKGTEDDSSRITGSSVFDFNGDGAAEVIYNDECFFRIYDGRDGSTLFEQPSEQITNIEYPVVADVDNDGNAEIIFSTTTQGTRCSIRGELDPVSGEIYSSRYSSGIQVWGDANDAWVSARRIWNQHAYHVTNVYEDGTIPREAIDHWRPSTQGSLYNVYRSNPRSLGLAPDLRISDIRLSSPAAGCGAVTTTLLITGRIRNDGELRVGPGVALVALGEWADGRKKTLRDAQGVPIHVLLSQSVEPARSVRFELLYDALVDGETEPPAWVELVVNPDLSIFDGTPVMAQSERECRMDNNRERVAVTEEALADLVLVSLDVDTATCPELSLAALVRNEGSARVSGLRVSFYAGAPDLGGRLLVQVERAGALEPGEEVIVLAEADLDALRLTGFPLVVYAVVEALGGEDECNLSNNVLAADEPKFCVPG